MGRNKNLLLFICVLFIINISSFNVQALSKEAIGNVNIVSTSDASLEKIEAWARNKNATEFSESACI